MFSGRSASEDPVGDGGEGFGGKGFLDAAVFGGRAGRGVLEEVVQAGQLFSLKILVAAFLKGLLDLREIFFGGDLKFLVAVEGEDRTLRFFQRRNGIVIQKKSEPG